MARQFIQAAHFYRGRRRPIRMVVLHATQGGEGAGKALATARFFAGGSRQASTHSVCDSSTTIDCVRDGDTAWGAKDANSDGLHVEICGMSEQNRAQWFDDASVASIDNCARRVAEWCRAYGIPAAQLGLKQVQDLHSRGITDHATVAKAFPSTGHWDPGPAFPWDLFLSRLHAHLGGATPVPPVVDLTHPAIYFPDQAVYPDSPEHRWIPALQRYAKGANAKGDLYRNFQHLLWGRRDVGPDPKTVPRDSIVIGLNFGWDAAHQVAGRDGGETARLGMAFLGIGT